MGRTVTGFTEAYAQSLSAACDLDLLPSDMVLVHDTLCCHDGHLCRIILKSYHSGRSNGSDTILDDTNEHNTHTHTQGKLYAFRHCMAGA